MFLIPVLGATYILESRIQSEHRGSISEHDSSLEIFILQDAE